MGRDAWIQGSPQGCVHGTPTQLDAPLLGHQPKGGARWVEVGGQRWTPQKKGVPRVVPASEFNRKSHAGLLAISQGKNPQAARKSIDAKLNATQRKRLDSPSPSHKSLESSGAMSQSMPTLAHGRFPPTPAYIRHF